MEPSIISVLAITAVVALVLLLRVWNFFARRYNDRLLASSACGTCGSVLGAECVPAARRKWKDEVQAMRKSGQSGVRWSNLELRCPHCDAVNKERELYAARRQRGASGR